MDPVDAMFKAISSRDPEGVKAALARGADPNAKLSQQGLDRCPAAILAARSREAQSLRALIQSAADVDEPDGAGETATMWAARMGKPKALAMLIDAGANIDTQNAEGENALMRALQWRPGSEQECAAMLIVAGADLRARDRAGKAALARSAGSGSLPALRALLRAGANPNERDSRGWTAAMEAAWHGDRACLVELAGAGAQMDAVGDDGQTAHLLALASGKFEVAALIASLIEEQALRALSQVVDGATPHRL